MTSIRAAQCGQQLVAWRSSIVGCRRHLDHWRGHVRSDCLFGRVRIRCNGTIDHGEVERRRQNVPRDGQIDHGRCRRQSRHAGAGGEASTVHIGALVDGTTVVRAAGQIIRAHGNGHGHWAEVRTGLNRGHGKTRGHCHNEQDHRDSTSKLKPHGQRHLQVKRYAQAQTVTIESAAICRRSRSQNTFRPSAATHFDIDQSLNQTL